MRQWFTRLGPGVQPGVQRVVGALEKGLRKGITPLEEALEEGDPIPRPFLSAYTTSNDYVYISVFVVFIRIRQWFTVFGPGEQTPFWAPLNTDHAL